MPSPMLISGVVIDVETGGLDELRNPLLAIAALDVRDGIVAREFEVRVAPFYGSVVDPEAAAVNGWTEDKWDGVPEATALRRLLDWMPIGRPIWIGHNTPYDRRFLLAALGRHGMEESMEARWSHRDIDLMVLAIVPQFAGEALPSRSLGALCELYLGTTQAHPHDALWDAKAALLCLLRLLSGITYTPFAARSREPWMAE